MIPLRFCRMMRGPRSAMSAHGDRKMRLLRRTVWMAAVAALLSVPSFAAPKPLPKPAAVPEGARFRSPVVAALDSCFLGQPNTVPSGTLDFLYPQPGDPDVYYT